MGSWPFGSPFASGCHLADLRRPKSLRNLRPPFSPTAPFGLLAHRRGVSPFALERADRDRVLLVAEQAQEEAEHHGVTQRSSSPFAQTICSKLSPFVDGCPFVMHLEPNRRRRTERRTSSEIPRSVQMAAMRRRSLVNGSSCFALERVYFGPVASGIIISLIGGTGTVAGLGLGFGSVCAGSDEPNPLASPRPGSARPRPRPRCPE